MSHIMVLVMVAGRPLSVVAPLKWRGLATRSEVCCRRRCGLIDDVGGGPAVAVCYRVLLCRRVQGRTKVDLAAVHFVVEF
jgi:hypothetical protein